MLTVLTANTPNGVKIPIALEELGLPYELVRINLGKQEQKRPEFLAHNPNGRIPVLIDNQGPGGEISIFESGAILLYLAERYPGLMPVDPVARIRALEYLFLQVSGIGPMFGQALWFLRSAPEPVPLAIERYQQEALRLTAVLERRLSEADWLAGSKYSIADVASFGWLRSANLAGITLENFPAVSRWLAAIAARPAVIRAISRINDLAIPSSGRTFHLPSGPRPDVHAGRGGLNR